MRIKLAVLLIAIVSSTVLPAVGATRAQGEHGGEVIDLNDHVRTKNFTSTYGVEHSATLDIENDTIVVRSYNPTNETKESAGFTVSLYNTTLNKVDQSLEPGERSREKFIFNDTISITRTNHTLYVSGWGGNATAKFTFTKDLGTDNPERYPVPEIVDATVVQNPPERRSGLYLAVTVENPGEQSYLTYMWVHTNETDGQRAPAGVTLGEDRTTWHVPLEEDPSDHVQGEVRLYRGSVKNDSGIRDQVYFEGTLDGETEIRHEEFEPITPPYERNAYEYEPPDSEGKGSGEGKRTGPTLGDRVVPATTIAFLVFVGVSGVLALFFRLR